MKKEYKHMDLFLLGATVIWGIKLAAMKIGLKYMYPQDYNVIRLIVASAAVWIVVAASKNHRKVSRADIKNILFVPMRFFYIPMVLCCGVKQNNTGKYFNDNGDTTVNRWCNKSYNWDRKDK